MGYSTDFEGSFNLDKPLNENQIAYLRAFSDTRRMKRDSSRLVEVEDSLRKAVGLPLGIEGEFFVAGQGFMGQDRDSSVIDSNNAPSTQPSLWCHWVPNDDGTCIEWDGGEKFYKYIEWMEYILKSFLIPWGFNVNGEVEWNGEESTDLGKIVIEDNKLTVLNGSVTYS